MSIVPKRLPAPMPHRLPKPDLAHRPPLERGSTGAPSAFIRAPLASKSRLPAHPSPSGQTLGDATLAEGEVTR